MPFSRVLFGLNIPKVGWVIARNLAVHFGSVDALMDARPEELEQVEGVGPDRAELIAEWFSDDENRALVEELRSLGLQMTDRRGRAPGRGPAHRQSVRHHRDARGGRRRSREQAKAALEALGAKVTGVRLEEDDRSRRRESHPGSKAAEGA